MSTALHVEQARAALQADPTQAQHWLDYIDALIQIGNLLEARKILDLGQKKGLQKETIEKITTRLAGTSGPLDGGVGEQQASPKAFKFAMVRPPSSVGEAMEHYKTGRQLIEMQRPSEAEASLLRAIELKPDFANAHYMLGVSLQARGRVHEAQQSFREAIRWNADFVEAHYNLGTLLQAQAQLSAAEASYRRAVKLRPSFVEAHQNLGVTLHALGRFDEAVACFDRALKLDRDNAQTFANLGATLQALGQHQRAEQNLRHATALAANDPAAHNNLGISLCSLGRFHEAEASFKQALALDLNMVDAHYNISTPLQNQGRLGEAEDALRQALRIQPSRDDAHGNLLFVLNYHPDKPAQEIFEAYRAYEQQFGAPLRAHWTAHTNSCDLSSRRLRIGYVSPDLRQHSVGYFLEPLLARHEHSRFELFAYAELAVEDAASARYKSYVDHWIPTRGMSDEALATRIRADAIDVLVDVAGHTAGNRLLVFARKPAPVSLSWLGYGYTTGLAAIDYLLTDAPSAPAGSEPLFSETPWRLPRAAYAYRPNPGMGEVSCLPSSSSGHVTFGTLTRAIRINHRTIRVWSEILKRVPHSRLVIDSKNFQHSSMQEAMTARFAEHGIAPERLSIGCHSPPWDTLRSMDIALDCFPHNSGTTLFESLYMGVPFITLAGRPSVGRLGRSILSGLDRPDWLEHWCADSEQDYIDKAVALATDLPALASIRSSLRTTMQASALMDESAFAQSVEHAYSQMFQLWATSQEAQA